MKQNPSSNEHNWHPDLGFSKVPVLREMADSRVTTGEGQDKPRISVPKSKKVLKK